MPLGCGEHVLEHSHFCEGSRDLKAAADAAGHPLMGVEIGYIVSIEANFPAGWRQQPCYDVEERRFAGAVGPDKAGDFSPSHMK